MLVAFHFRVDPEASVYAWAIERIFFEHLLLLQREDLHCEIFHGDLLSSKFSSDENAKETLLLDLVGYNPRKWKTVDQEDFASAIFSESIFVLAIDGLPCPIQDQIDHLFTKKIPSYLGAIEVDLAKKTHWTLYQKSLVPLSRWVDGNLRLFYRKFEEEQGNDVKDIGTAKELERLGFQVSWEDIGARRSVLDSYQSFEHAKRHSELQRYILEHLTRVADEILLRISIVQPELKDELHAAFQTFESIETSANVAQVALSCRRFLERLANNLYPPRKELVNGKEVGPKQYRNRLWAYAEEKLGDTEGKAFLSQLDDIGKRIDRLDDLVNKGVHDRIMPSDLHRLIVGLLVVAYDLLALSVPPLIASNIPYAESITAFAKKVASKPLSKNEDPNKWTN